MVNAQETMIDKGISAMQPILKRYQNAAKATTEDALVHLQEIAGKDYLNIRVGSADEAIQSSIQQVLGVGLPPISQTESSDGVTTFGIGPSEWLACLPNNTAASKKADLEKALEGQHHLMVDVTGGTTTLSIHGEKARDVLEKGTYVDLHPSVFKINQHYATVVSGAPAIILSYAENHYHLIVRRSFSDHLARWVIDASAEYGYSVS